MKRSEPFFFELKDDVKQIKYIREFFYILNQIMFITNVLEVLNKFSTDKYALKSSFQACQRPSH